MCLFHCFPHGMGEIPEAGSVDDTLSDPVASIASPPVVPDVDVVCFLHVYCIHA